jgi:hypothetical protein
MDNIFGVLQRCARADALDATINSAELSCMSALGTFRHLLALHRSEHPTIVVTDRMVADMVLALGRVCEEALHTFSASVADSESDRIASMTVVDASPRQIASVHLYEAVFRLRRARIALAHGVKDAE